MNVLLAHNSYQQPGGEDVVFDAEAALLRSNGHQVVEFRADNHTIHGLGTLQAGLATFWSRSSYRQIADLIARVQPEVCHFHNTFPLISPAAYYACRAAGVPVVQTLHNYRLLCPSATLYRDGRCCEDCVGRAVAWPGILHACYRESRLATTVVAAMVGAHRALRTWTRQVDVYITPTEFARQRLIAGRLPPDRVVAKSNFVLDDPGIGRHGGGYALFVGRLSSEKGVETLLRAWESIGNRLPLMIVGSGPLEDLARERRVGVEWLGQHGKEHVYTLMKDATLLVFPSELYETFGLAMIEAFATALPVVASRLGAATEIIDHGATGLHFTPGDADDLARQVAWAISHPQELEDIGRRGREAFEAKYTARQNYDALIAIYHRAIEQRRSS